MCFMQKDTYEWRILRTKLKVIDRLQLIKGDKYVFSRWEFKFHNQNQSAGLRAAELAAGREKEW